jgi:hypothetical protein
MCSTDPGSDVVGSAADASGAAPPESFASLHNVVLPDLLTVFAGEGAAVTQPLCHLAKTQLRQPDTTGLPPDVLLAVVPILASFLRWCLHSLSYRLCKLYGLG